VRNAALVRGWKGAGLLGGRILDALRVRLAGRSVGARGWLDAFRAHLSASCVRAWGWLAAFGVLCGSTLILGVGACDTSIVGSESGVEGLSFLM
jgi:hypothetical protein